jgi:class 3 adenylate cyclase
VNADSALEGTGLLNREVEAIRSYLARRRGSSLWFVFSEICPPARAAEELPHSAPHREALRLKLRDEHARLLRDAVDADGAGLLLVQLEDAVLAVFSEADRALQTALRSRREADRWNCNRPESERLVLRLGVDGLPSADGESLSESQLESLSLRAAGIADAAQPGQILVTDDVRRAVVPVAAGPSLPPFALEWEPVAADATDDGPSPAPLWQASSAAAPPVRPPAPAPGPLSPEVPGSAARGSLAPPDAGPADRPRPVPRRGLRPAQMLHALVASLVAVTVLAGTAALLYGTGQGPGSSPRQKVPGDGAPPDRPPRDEAGDLFELPPDGLEQVLQMLRRAPGRYNDRDNPVRIISQVDKADQGMTLRIRVRGTARIRVFHVDTSGLPSLLTRVPAVLRAGRGTAVRLNQPAGPGIERVIVLSSSVPVEQANGLFGLATSGGQHLPYFKALAQLMRRRPSSSEGTEPHYAIAAASLTRDAAGRLELVQLK